MDVCVAIQRDAFQTSTTATIDFSDIKGQKKTERPELANMVTNVAKMVGKVAKLEANLVTKYDVNMTLSPSSH
ncbi:hypothetical protein TNCV_804791 [Trichonephila clavipes]|nr:hypothetical protein TNCV_804791 [Trichonephila clavipes]